jgi:photosystem II stability/assembly factor-like uncharacterized protein
MKRFEIVSVFILLSTVMNAQIPALHWRWQNPLPQGQLLTWIRVFDGANAVVHRMGTFWQTSDGGSSWTQFTAPGITAHACMIGRDTIVAIGATGTVFVSKDGGGAWTRWESSTRDNLGVVAFGDPLTGWIAGDSVLLKTDDGGTTWKKLGAANGIRRMFFANKDSGWCFAYSSSSQSYFFRRTTDGGAHWTTKSSIAAYDFCVVGDSIGWAAGSGGSVYTTINGGRSWLRFQTNTTENLSAVCFTNKDTGWVSTESGAVLKTTDGGRFWVTQVMTGEYLYAMHFIDALTGYGVGSDGIILGTTNGGARWFRADPGLRAPLTRIAFVDEHAGWACGNSGANGYLLRTTDGGVHWAAQQQAHFVQDIMFVDRNVGWLLYYKNGIARTADGGVTWTPISEFAATHVFFTDTANGWALASNGSTGSIARTTDGGRSWAYQFNGVLLNDIRFANTRVGWAVGENGSIVATTNGGASWQEQNSNSSARLNCLAAVDADTVVAVGTKGTVLRTTNGGSTWQTRPDPTTWTRNITALHFADPTHGYMTDGYGTVYVSTDGGKYWGAQYVLVTGDSPGDWFSFLSVCFINPSLGWVSGQNGCILRYDGTPSGTSVEQPPVLDASCLSVYPHPVTDNAGIIYSLRVTGHAELALYSSLGNKQAQIFEGFEPAGRHTKWFSNTIPNGLYILVLRTNEGVVTRKVLLFR